MGWNHHPWGSFEEVRCCFLRMAEVQWWYRSHSECHWSSGRSWCQFGGPRVFRLGAGEYEEFRRRRCRWNWGMHIQWPSHLYIVYFRSTPHPATVTTRIITFLVGNLYKPSFATVTGWGQIQSICICIHTSELFLLFISTIHVFVAFDWNHHWLVRYDCSSGRRTNDDEAFWKVFQDPPSGYMVKFPLVTSVYPRWF